jgi:hypothetical protein
MASTKASATAGRAVAVAGRSPASTICVTVKMSVFTVTRRHGVLNVTRREIGSMTTEQTGRGVIRQIRIDFDLPVDPSDEEMQMLDRIVGRICDRECPEGWAFWPPGHGSMPNFSQVDAMFLGKPVDPTAPASEEPTWDDSIYQIDCSVRELYPEEIEERKARRAAREARRRRLSYRLRRCWLRMWDAVVQF